MENDIRIELKFKNNLLLSAIEESCETPAAFCANNKDICYGSLINLINFKNSPVGNYKKKLSLPTHLEGVWWNPFALKISSILKKDPFELFPESTWNKKEKNKFQIETSEEETKLFVEGLSGTKILNPEETEQKQLNEKVVHEVLLTIAPREQTMIKKLYGFDGPAMNPAQIAREYSLSRTRVDQIIKKGLRKLRNPIRRKHLEKNTGFKQKDNNA